MLRVPSKSRIRYINILRSLPYLATFEVYLSFDYDTDFFLRYTIYNPAWFLSNHLQSHKNKVVKDTNDMSTQVGLVNKSVMNRVLLMLVRIQCTVEEQLHVSFPNGQTQNCRLQASYRDHKSAGILGPKIILRGW